MELYALYKKGITPNGRGIRHEAAFYRAVMIALEGLSAEAESWYTDQLDKRAKRRR